MTEPSEYRPVAILGVPTRFGTSYPGSERTPGLLRCLGTFRRLEQWAGTLSPPVLVEDAGDVAVPDAVWTSDGYPLRAADAVCAVAEAQAARIGRLLAAGKAPLVIGGDCTTMLGTATGLHRAGRPFGLVSCDAHGDFNTAETTPSGNIHGMTVAALAGRGAAPLVNLFGGDVTVLPARMVLLGVRDLDPPEAVALPAADVTVLAPGEIVRRGPRWCGERALAIACGAGDASPADGLLLHLDLDVLDPLVAPGVGLPVPGGLSLETLLEMLDPLLSSGRLLAAEITEAAPVLDGSGRTAANLELLLRRLVVALSLGSGAIP